MKVLLWKCVLASLCEAFRSIILLKAQSDLQPCSAMWRGSITRVTYSAHMESGWPSRGTGLEPLKSLASTLSTEHSFHGDYSQCDCSQWLIRGFFMGLITSQSCCGCLFPELAYFVQVSFLHPFLPLFFSLWNSPWYDSDIFLPCTTFKTQIGACSSKQNNVFVPSIEGLSRNQLKAFAQVKPGRWHRWFCTFNLKAPLETGSCNYFLLELSSGLLSCTHTSTL